MARRVDGGVLVAGDVFGHEVVQDDACTVVVGDAGNEEEFACFPAVVLGLGRSPDDVAAVVAVLACGFAVVVGAAVPNESAVGAVAVWKQVPRKQGARQLSWIVHQGEYFGLPSHSPAGHRQI